MARPKLKSKKATSLPPINVASELSDMPEIGGSHRVDTPLTMPIGSTSAGVNTFNRGIEAGAEAAQPALKAAGLVAEAKQVDEGKAALAAERQKAQEYQKLLQGGAQSLQAYVNDVKEKHPEFGSSFQAQLDALLPAFQGEGLTREDYTTLTHGQFDAWNKQLQDSENSKSDLAEKRHGYTMEEIAKRAENALSLEELKAKGRQRLLYYGHKTKSGDWALVKDKADEALKETQDDLDNVEAALHKQPYNKDLLGSKAYLQSLIKMYQGFSFKATAAGAQDEPKAPDEKKRKKYNPKTGKLE